MRGGIGLGAGPGGAAAGEEPGERAHYAAGVCAHCHAGRRQGGGISEMRAAAAGETVSPVRGGN